MLQKAKVIAIEDGMATISVERESACGHDCGSCAGCGMQSARIIADAENSLGAKVGDMVEVESETAKVLKIAGVVYILPLVLFFAAYFALVLTVASETAAMLGGMAGFLLGVLCAIRLNRREAKAASVTHRIIRVLR